MGTAIFNTYVPLFLLRLKGRGDVLTSIIAFQIALHCLILMLGMMELHDVMYQARCVAPL